MRRLGELLPLATLEDLRLARPLSHRIHLTLGLLLGVAGFLPLSPSEAHFLKLDPTAVSEVESAWTTFGSPWHNETLRANAWDLARTRPSNHPLLRLHAAAALVHHIAGEGGLLATMHSVIRADDPVARLRDLTTLGALPGIGEDRAIEILASAILPVLFAIASHGGDEMLADDAARVWEQIPSPGATSVTRRAMRQVCGDMTLRGIGARGAQGLLHLDTALCLPRRCFDCPVAAAELAVND
jgi:hypothetical protein